MRKKIISVFIAFVLCFSFSVNVVMAAENGFPTSAKFVTNLTEYEGLALVDQFYNNSTVQAKGLDKYNSILCISYNGGNYTYDVACIKMSAVTYHQTRYYVRPNNYIAYSALCERSDNSNYIYARQISSIANNDYSVNSNASEFNTLIGINFCPDYNNFYYVHTVSPANDYLIANRPQEFTAFVYNNSYIPPFDPVLDPLLDYPYNLDVQHQGFLEWLLVDNKYELINGAILQNHVGGWVDIFADYGGSQSFFRRVALQFINANSINMGVNDINDALSITRRLYRQYLAEKSDTVRNHIVDKLEDTEDIKPDTNETNNTLITNDSNDTVDISILRDILRGVLNIPNVIHELFQILFDKLDGLNNTVNIVNDSGVGFSAAEIWGSGDITQSSNYQALSDSFVEHGVIISDVESLQYNYLAGQTQKDSFTVSVDMPDEYINGEFTKKTITHTVDSNSKMFDTLVLFRKIIALAVILFYVVRLKLALPSLIKGE